ncbi:bifunctional UDP-N-acetylglucosamine diphosphorylase/glucosamine-1-phosphate N-acetyltransferase GlmU [Sciscionella marina]|uniref:bifunctional UDP-N-acetylglucosamine diphosphorylase/glucosamine-1-phosphate N-acetyltransferase GlmU n=1 Tax=Sciscionella marina TaxID=508770 RepID=UPI0003739F4A
MTLAGRELSTIVLAAGEGTRMRSRIPKMLHRIAGRTLVEHAVRAVAALSPGHLVAVTGHGREEVGAHLTELGERIGARVETAVQEQQLGTGHAVACGLAALPEDLTGTVVVTYGDVPLLDTATIEELLTEHTERGNAVTALSAVVPDPTGYGRIVRESGAVTGIVEHKDANAEQRGIQEINAGVYAFDLALLRWALGQLSTENVQGELYLPDVLSIARAQGRSVGALVCADPWQVEGVNDRAQLATLGAEYNRRLVRTALLGGVTMTDPSTVWLDAEAELGRDVLVEPNVQLRGRTVVGEGATVGPDTTLNSVRIGAGASVVRTHGTDAVIGDGAEVGPFAYLRPGSELGEQGKIGAYVEVKDSSIGAGTKVPHLSYIGGATIGEHSNIGAASVMANYDGTNKHRTVVGSHVRMGSDNMYVAPVTVGDGAYSGAGAVIREDVPPGALAVSGGPQRNIEGWVAKKRPGTAAAKAAEAAQASADSNDQE